MSRRDHGLLLIAACLAAMALRLMVPMGWMPVATGTGVSLSLCSGATLPGDPLAPPGDPGPCGYALALGPVLLGAALLLPLVALPILPATDHHPARPAGRRHRPRPPGQGPPRA